MAARSFDYGFASAIAAGMGSLGTPTTAEPMKTTPTPLMVPASEVGVPMKRMFSDPAATARLDESVGRLIYWLRACFIFFDAAI